MLKKNSFRVFPQQIPLAPQTGKDFYSETYEGKLNLEEDYLC